MISTSNEYKVIRPAPKKPVQETQFIMEFQQSAFDTTNKNIKLIKTNKLDENGGGTNLKTSFNEPSANNPDIAPEKKN